MSIFTRGEPDASEATDPDAEHTIRIARRRFARRQWTRRWLAWRRVVVAVLLVGALAAGVWLVFFSSVLAVTGVRVDGTSVLDPRQVRHAAEVPLGAPLATVDLDAVTARLEDLAPVKSVDVSRSWPDKVRIFVVERHAVAVVAQGDTLRGLDAEGVLFRSYPSRPPTLPLISMGGRTRADALAEAARVAGSLPSSIARRVDFVEARTVDTISLQLKNGRTVRWGSADDSASKAEVLGVLLRQKAEHYDVSVPGQPILRR